MCKSSEITSKLLKSIQNDEKQNNEEKKKKKKKDKIKRGIASIVANIKSVQSRQIVRLMVSNVAVVKE